MPSEFGLCNLRPSLHTCAVSETWGDPEHNKRPTFWRAWEQVVLAPKHNHLNEHARSTGNCLFYPRGFVFQAVGLQTPCFRGIWRSLDFGPKTQPPQRTRQIDTKVSFFSQAVRLQTTSSRGIWRLLDFGPTAQTPQRTRQISGKLSVFPHRVRISSR